MRAIFFGSAIAIIFQLIGFNGVLSYYTGACDFWYSDAEHYWFISLVDPLPFGRKHRRSSTTLTSTVDVRTSLLFQLFV